MTLSEYFSSPQTLLWPEATELNKMGAIYLNKSRMKAFEPDFLLNAGDYFRIHREPRRYDLPSFTATSRIIEENADFVVLNKPAGLPVHATIDNLHDNIIEWLKSDSHFSETPLFVTHRLDAVTEGLLVIAKTESFLQGFNKLLIRRQVEKIYEALHMGPKFPSGILEDWMQKSPAVPKIVCAPDDPGAQLCQLEILESKTVSPHVAMARIRLLTGRTHQIRVQLAARGCIILGDHLYGAQEKVLGKNRIALRCSQLQFRWLNKEWDFNLGAWEVQGLPLKLPPL